MRNLRLVQFKAISSASCNVQRLAVNHLQQELYLVADVGIVIINTQNWTVSNTVEMDPCLENQRLSVGAEYLLESNALCIAMQDGDIMLYHCDSQHVECVGCVEVGLQFLAWSPDQELLLLCTTVGKIIMMTKDFDVVTEMLAMTEDFGQSMPVNVGWGKKETQFHGSEGKPTSQSSKQVDKLPTPAAEWDDGKPRLSWRGDGEYFACCGINTATGARQLKFWNREGILQSTSESMDGIEQPLHWRPSGNYIATAQRKPHRYDILLFERNGLRRGEFALPFGKLEVKVVELMWNIDSKVLAIWLEELSHDKQVDSTPRSCVQLWCCNNFHWYLKQELKFSATVFDRIAYMQWDTEISCRLHIVSLGGKYRQYNWIWDVTYSQGCPQENLSSVAVIDGDRLLLTPFSIMVVPPPISAFYIQLDKAINQVCFGPPAACNDIALTLSDNTVILYSYEKSNDREVKDIDNSIKLSGAGGTGFQTSLKLPALRQRFRILDIDRKQLTEMKQLQHLTWIESNVFLAVMWNDSKNSNYLLCLEITEDLEQQMIVRHMIEIADDVLRIFSNNDTASVVIELLDGSIWKFFLGDSNNNPRLIPWLLRNGAPLQLPQPCQYIATAMMNGLEVAIGANERFRLYINNKQIAANCTSFCVHDSFIIFSTHSHTCRFLSLATDVDNLKPFSSDETLPSDENIRRVERGSKIVTVVVGSTRLLLQMPRGNLEAINPRALLLHSIRHLLDKLKFREAFLLMRKHRINSNLIYDHNPKTFMENIDLFINRLNDVNYLNLFLSDLRDEDVTVTMYPVEHSKKQIQESTVSSKIDKICDIMREALTRIDFNKYIISIITTYIKKSRPELDKALQLINTLREESSAADKLITRQDALKYLLMLVNVDELYNVALGTYDFDLVIMIAEKSQKDPKEYLPFLNSLRKMDSDYAKYSIDKHLKNYDKAIIHLSRCGEEYFNELLNLIKEQRLYAQAISLFSNDSHQYKSICRAYGEYLSNRDHQLEAAFMYMKGDEYTLAMSSFIKCKNWHQAFCMASELRLSKQQVIEMAKKVAGDLCDARRFQEASRVLLDYGNDIEEAILSLIKGYLWNEALRIIHFHDRKDMIETHLKPALMEGYRDQIAHFVSSIRQFNEYCERLVQVRQEKYHKQQLADVGDLDDDLYSETTSITGQSTRSTTHSRTTGRTSKSRRKAQRKKYSLRRGSPYEDVALMEALSQMIMTLFNTKNDVRSFLETLTIFNHISEAASLQKLLEEYIAVVKKSLKIIWPPGGTHLNQFGPDYNTEEIANAMRQNNFTSHYMQEDEITYPSEPSVARDIVNDTKWKLGQLLN